jgi:hypothetical protein
MPAGRRHEAFLTADANAETIELVERHPRVRDRAIFIGDAEDVVPDPVRAWPSGNPGVDGTPLPVRGLHPRLRSCLGARSSRAARGARDGRRAVVRHLRRRLRVRPTAPAAGDRLARTRARGGAGPARARGSGPRIDPAAVPVVDGLQVRGYVHELYRPAQETAIAYRTARSRPGARQGPRWTKRPRAARRSHTESGTGAAAAPPARPRAAASAAPSRRADAYR